MASEIVQDWRLLLQHLCNPLVERICFRLIWIKLPGSDLVWQPITLLSMEINA